MSKLEVTKKQICDTIMNMSAEVFYNFCFDIEYYNMNYGFDIFDCEKCGKVFPCGQTCRNAEMDECYDKFMSYYEVGKYEVK